MWKCEFLPTQHAVDSDASRDDWASRVCAGAVCRVDRKRDKLDRQILDSQERAFWDVHRPAVSHARIQGGGAPGARPPPFSLEGIFLTLIIFAQGSK